MFGLPFGLMPGVIGDVIGDLPLPAKITIQVMPPIDLAERFGEDPDVEEINEELLARMQDVLTALGRERRLPVIG